MGNLFNLNNPFWRFMGKLVDIFVLNILWIVCCIPIVTIGPATTAVYYVCMKLARDEEGYTVRDFFKSFRQNLRQGMIIGIIMTVLAVILYLDYRFYLALRVGPKGILLGLFFVTLMLYTFEFSYVFALLARFENTVKNTMKNALIMSLRHMPKTIVMVFLILLLTLASIGVLPLLMLGFPFSAFLCSYFLVGIFDQYIPKEEDETQALPDEETPEEREERVEEAGEEKP